MSDSSDSVKSARSDKVTKRSTARRQKMESNNDGGKIQIKIPQFYPDEPELWFAQVEGQFVVSNVTDDTTKFYFVTGHLDPQYAKEVKDIITSPPATNKFEKLKEELVKRLSASRERKIQQLLMHEELGSRKPSQFLRHLQSLAGSTVPDDFIRSIWCSRLPSNLQTLIASQPASSLEASADLADRVHDIVAPVAHVASTSTPAIPGSMESMASEIAELKAAFRSLTTQLNQQQQSGQRSRSNNRRPNNNQRRRPRSRSQSNYRRFPICWYHDRHGSKANHCVKPCDFEKSGNAQGSQ